jgi:(4S)-4-hydroxy-5-phosphonooxypentane-2,3-dione isomerase
MTYVVAVTFRAKPEFRTQFRTAMIENATASRTREPGCRTFDVCENADGSEIFLYEIYDDEAAFQAHLATDHYRRFSAQVADWVEHKQILKYRRVSPPA